MFGVPTSAFLICLMAGLGPAMAQTPAQRPPDRQAPAKASSGARPPDPTRDPNTPGYVKAKELPDGTCAGACHAAARMTTNAKLDNAIVLRAFRFIDFSWNT